MITLEQNNLVFRFPEVHQDAECRIGFQRTLRIPDDGKHYPLPAGLGNFRLAHVDDFADRLPHSLSKRGGVVMPMWQAEAMWINFGGRSADGYPMAIKVATGKINALTGKSWTQTLNKDPQDYLVVPKQPWIDGFCVEKGLIRQFVAMPLGQGFSVEEQITQEAEHGGIQIIAYPMKWKVYEDQIRRRPALSESFAPSEYQRSPLDMGLAPGGRMKQEIYADPYGIDAWDLDRSSRCFVTIVNAVSWSAVTATPPPEPPLTAEDYQENQLPWFDYYAADQRSLEGAGILKDLKGVADIAMNKSSDVFADDTLLSIGDVTDLGPDRRVVREPTQVREGRF